MDHELLGHARIAERDLLGVARYIIPIVRHKRAGEGWRTKHLLDRILVVDARLNRACELRIDHYALVRVDGRAAGERHRHCNRDKLGPRELHVHLNLSWARLSARTHPRLACRGAGLNMRRAGTGASLAARRRRHSRKGRYADLPVPE